MKVSENRSLCALHQAALLQPKKSARRSRSLGRTNKLLSLSLGLSLAGLAAARANTELDVANGQTDLTLAGTYTQNTAPTTTNDVTFTAATTYAPAAFTVPTALGIGTLNDLDATQTLAISGAGTITLNGGTNVVAPNAADLLYVAAASTLNINNAIALAASGNFDIAGSSTLSGVISGTGGFTKTGAGTLILSNTNNTFSGGTTVNSGILQLNGGGGNGVLRGIVTVNTGGSLYLNAADAFGFNTGATVNTVNVNGGTVDNRVGGNQSYLTNFVLTGGTVQSTGGGSYNFQTGFGITTNASSVTSTFSALTLRNSSNMSIAVAQGTTANGIDFNITGAIGQNGGTNGINKTGAGVLALSGANTYTGATTISSGTLSLGSGGTTGSLNVTSVINNSGIFAINRSNPVIQGMDFNAAALTGTGGFSQLGTGTTTLNAANTYTGATTVNAGTLNLAGSLTSAITVNNGGRLTGSGNGTTARTSSNLTVNGGGSVTLLSTANTALTIGGTTTLGSAGTYAAGVFGTLSFTLGTSNAVETLNTTGLLTANNAFINITNPTQTGTYTLLNFGSLAPGANFSLSSSMGNVLSQLAGRNTETLTINPTSLTLNITGPATPGVAFFNGAVSSVWNDVSNPSIVNFSSDVDGSTDTGNIVGATTDVILNALNATTNRGTSNLTQTLGASTIINSLSVNGIGTNTLAADGSTLTINALGDSNTASDGSYTGNAAGNGIAIVNGANAFTINVPVLLGNTQTWTNNSANLFTVGGTVGTSAATTTQTLTLTNTSTGGTTLNGVISNGPGGAALALVVNNSGTGITTLSGANTYTGGTTISSGTLQLNGVGSLGSGAITNNGALIYNTTNAQTIGTIINGTGGLTLSGSGTLTLSGANTFTGNLVVSGGTLNASFSNNSAVANGRAFGSFGNEQTAGKTVTINNGATVAFTVGNVLGNSSSTVDQAPAMAFVVNQGGTLLINPTVADGNSFGAITLNGGTLTTGNGFSAQYQVATLLKDITVGGTTASTINSIGTNAATNSIMLGDQAAGNNTINFIVADATSNANADLIVSAKFTNSPTGNGSLGNLAKSGAGTMVLNAASDYSGTTSVIGGTLVGNNDKALGNTSGLSVSGGTFDLRGTTAGTVTLGTNATFSLTSGAVNLQLGTTFDQLVSSGTGAFTITGGTFALDISGPGFSYANPYALLTGFGGANSASGLTFTGYDTANYTASLANTGILSFTAVPEPSTYALALTGVSMLFLLRRRKAA